MHFFKAVQRQQQSFLAVSAVIVSALLTWGAFPVTGSPLLIWTALVPLIVLCRTFSPIPAFLCGLCYGAISIQLICHWIYLVPGFRWFHGLPLALYLGLFPALWFLCCSLFGRRHRSFLIPGAALWVLLDYGKAHAGFLSFPWCTLAHSQYELTPLLQISAFSGEYGVTFLIVLTNVALAEWYSSQRAAALAATVLVLAAVWLQGLFTLYTAADDRERHMSVAVVQPYILHTERQSEEGTVASFSRLCALAESAAAPAPDLIVLPETAIRFGQHDTRQLQRVSNIAQHFGVPILFGASESEKFSAVPSTPGQSGFNSGFRLLRHNSAFLSLPGRSGQENPYRKQRLVPFGEYNPLPYWLQLPAWFIQKTGTITAGHTSRQFVLPDSVTVSPVICWEILFADLIRESIGTTRPDLIAHLNNSNWFGRSSAATQQNSAAVFRAIEQRIPVAVASNTGPSALFDAFGRRSTCDTEMFIPTSLTGRVVPGSMYTATIYQRHGNLFILLCLFLFCGISAFPIIFGSTGDKAADAPEIKTLPQELWS